MTEGHIAANAGAPAEAATRYDFAAIEQYYGEAWERADCFAPAKDGEAFAIMMPPPNVTGTLHIGHALDNTLPDILVRRARMQGKSALYQPGTDHASIAVHVVLERIWAKEGKTRFDYGREAFMEKAWEWKDHSHGVITGQLRRLGISCDWGNERFTMDAAYSNAVNKVFVLLHEKGLIYRGMRLVNWDPKMQTAVSDLEVKHKQVNGNLWHVRYKFADGKTYQGEDGIEIATTRPETILADGAIAIHPQDNRAKDLVGRKVIVPIADREIPIIADEMVDPEFGSGMVKITAAHDFNDFECTKRHQGEVDIPIINLMNPDATMNANCPPAYVGLDRFVARKKIVADIEAMGQLIKVEPHSHNVGHAERDDTILEPYLTWQWYVKCGGIAKRCLEAADKGDVKFVNERDAKVYRHWLENIQDWCISRQLWWGHRIPAWYRDVEGQAEPEIYVGEKAPKGDGWRQDNDILDTWFSSALWPFVTQGWPEHGERVQRYYPGQVIMSGRDILFFWLVRMMMMGLEVTDTVPFQTIFTHGLILDEKGQKMSKSKGNVVDPMELINEFGSDALRLTMASIASAEDMRYSRSKVEQSRNFCTKLWNAARFMKMQGVIWDEPARKAFNWSAVKHPVNQWMVSELAKVVREVDTQLDGYAFNQAALAAYHFTWGIWCDWYLELCKGLFADPATAEETKLVMGWGFDQLLRLLHPFVPYITEALWRQHTLEDEAFVMMQSWPKPFEWKVDGKDAASMQRVITVVNAIRQARTLHRLPPKAKLSVLTQSDLTKDWIDAAGWQMVRHLAGVDGPVVRSDKAKAGEAIVVVEGQELMIPLEGLLDIAAERARLEKELEKSVQEQAKIAGLLGNEAFVAKAPADVLSLNKERQSALQEQLQTLKGLLSGPYAAI